jgi:hypothetical protein
MLLFDFELASSGPGGRSKDKYLTVRGPVKGVVLRWTKVLVDVCQGA